MNERTRSFLITAVALLFLAGLGAFLARPVFQSSEGRAPVLPEPTHTESAVETKSPEPPTKGKRTEAGGFENPFPRSCLTKLLPEPGLGRVAVASFGRPDTKNKVTIAPLFGGRPTTFAAEPPLEWSVSGGFVATRGPRLWTSRGDPLELTERGMDMPWAWSPIADCLVTWDEEGLIVIEPAADRKTLLLSGEPRDSLRFSPPPVRWLLVGEKVYDLRSGDVVQDAPISASGLGEPRRFAYESYCTELGREYEHETCSWNERLVAAVRAGRLILTSVGGGASQPLTTDSGFTDVWPTWGPRRTGILFIRRPVEPGPAQIWFIREGGRAADTRLRSIDTAPAEGDWSIYLDWTLDRPLGMNPPVPGH